MALGVDFNYFLNAKYAQLQQQANADTSRAASAALTAQSGADALALTAPAQAKAATAAANLDNTRATLAPAESKSNIALQGAQANLYGQQASVVVPEATARIGQIGAETGLIKAQTATETATPFAGFRPGTLPSLAAPVIARATGPATVASTGPAPSGILPTAQQIGETHDQWVARLRGMGF